MPVFKADKAAVEIERERERERCICAWIALTFENTDFSVLRI